jgi:hypothetical protein
MMQTQVERDWYPEQTRSYENPKSKVIIDFNINNPDTRKLVKIVVVCPHCKKDNIKKPRRLSMKELKKLHAIGSATLDQSNNFACDYFKCDTCNFPLYYCMHFLKVESYVDDVHHLGLMTSGVGGY